MTKYFKVQYLLFFRFVFFIFPIIGIAKNDHNNLIVLLILNGISTNHQTVVFEHNQDIFLPEADFNLLRLQKPPQNPTYHNNQAYYGLKKSGLNYELNQQNLTLNILAKAQYFISTNIELPVNWITPDSSKFGAFVNFDTIIDSVENEQIGRAIVDVNMFQPYGTLSSDFLTTVAKNNKTIVRLNTSWRFDQAENMRTFVFGDTNSIPGTWGRSVLFGGIQIRKNFQTQPNFAPYPNKLISGEATLPSSVELYLDNIKLFQDNIEPGEFNINFQPPNIGNNNIRVVTTDILGRQHFIDLPFYSSPVMLKPGLHNYLFELGLVRENFGTKSLDYNNVFVNFMDSVGITRKLTAEWRMESTKNRQTFGIGSYWLVANKGILSNFIIASNEKHKKGSMYILGFDKRQSVFNFGFRLQATSSNFKQFGSSSSPPAKYQTQANAGIILKPFGIIGMSYIKQHNRVSDNSQVINLNFSKTFSKNWYFNAFSVFNLQGDRNVTLFFSLTKMIGNNKTASVNFSLPDSGYDSSFNFNKSIVDNTGFGYRINGLSGSNNNRQLNTDIDYESEKGIYSYNFSHQNNRTAHRVSANGSLIYLNRHFAISKPITSSYAMIDVPNQKGLDVYFNNRIVAHTDNSGRAIIPNLSPYTENKIFIAGEQLPITTQMATLSQNIIPYHGVGVYIPFNVRSTQSVFLRVKLDTGDYLPAGAKLYDTNNPDKLYPVAYSGEVYIDNVTKHNQLIAEYGENNKCRITFDLDLTDEFYRDIGDVDCVS